MFYRRCIIRWSFNNKASCPLSRRNNFLHQCNQQGLVAALVLAVKEASTMALTKGIILRTNLDQQLILKWQPFVHPIKRRVIRSKVLNWAICLPHLRKMKTYYYLRYDFKESIRLWELINGTENHHLCVLKSMFNHTLILEITRRLRKIPLLFRLKLNQYSGQEGLLLHIIQQQVEK